VVITVAMAGLPAAPLSGAPGDRTQRLITTPGSATFDAFFDRASEDGSRVWFETSEPNQGLGDTHAGFDLYERGSDGALRLVSAPGAGNFDVAFGGGSGDGSRVWFLTDQPNPGLGDTDTNTDVYERTANGGLRLVSAPGAGVFESRYWVLPRMAHERGGRPTNRIRASVTPTRSSMYTNVRPMGTCVV
jgi:hypothetical protein